jgi:hypothetical protein
VGVPEGRGSRPYRVELLSGVLDLFVALLHRRHRNRELLHQLATLALCALEVLRGLVELDLRGSRVRHLRVQLLPELRQRLALLFELQIQLADLQGVRFPLQYTRAL